MKAAWLRFPAFNIETLEQKYTRLAEGRYLYESGGGRFVAEMEVSEAGFVTRYPNIWEAEAGHLLDLDG